jgi:hypothetical protein
VNTRVWLNGHTPGLRTVEYLLQYHENMIMKLVFVFEMFQDRDTVSGDALRPNKERI